MKQFKLAVLALLVCGSSKLYAPMEAEKITKVILNGNNLVGGLAGAVGRGLTNGLREHAGFGQEGALVVGGGLALGGNALVQHMAGGTPQEVGLASIAAAAVFIYTFYKWPVLTDKELAARKKAEDEVKLKTLQSTQK